MYKKFCGVCKKQFNAKVTTAKFCSLICKYKASGEPKTLAICLFCNQEFFYYKSVKRNGIAYCCSFNCKSLWSKSYDRKLQILKTAYEKRVIKKNDNECWDWTGPKTTFGYGLLSFNSLPINAHRAAWIIYKGKIDIGLHVLHKCDNPPCTNLNHLFLGTAKDNTKDMMVKGRGHFKKGMKAINSVLNEEKVKQIRILLNQNIAGKKIATLFDISPGIISLIKNNKIWKQSN